MRLCLFLHIRQLQKTNTALCCSQVNGAHLKVLPRSDLLAKATSLSQAPRRHYRFWRVELCCHVIKPQAAVIHQELNSVLEISLRQCQVETSLLQAWGRVQTIGAGVRHHEGSCLLSWYSGDWNSLLAVLWVCSVTLRKSVFKCSQW